MSGPGTTAFARVAVRGIGISGTGHGAAPRDLEDWFPGRWNPRRAMWDHARTHVHAVAGALDAAGAWVPRSGAVVEGGQVVGTDTPPYGPSRRFAQQLRQAAETGRPVSRAGEFLFALPSSMAALAGMAFGLEEHQTTLVAPGLAGLEAVGYAADLIRAGRLRRVVACAVSGLDPDARDVAVHLGLLDARAARLPLRAEEFTLAVAWCLEAAPAEAAFDRPGHAEVLGLRESTAGEPTTAESPAPRGTLAPADGEGSIPELYRGLSAPTLLAATRRLRAAGAAFDVHQTDPRTGRTVTLSLRPGAASTEPVS